MKTEINSIIQNLCLRFKWVYLKVKFVLAAFAILFTLMIWSGCNKENEDLTEDETTVEQVHLAFAGGGWRALTGHAAWTMSLLDNGNKQLSDVFSNVNTISSNSGGSWFSTMLMYSQPFVDSIQAADAVESWSTLEGGWIGGQYQLFYDYSSLCDYKSGEDFLECMLAKILIEKDQDPYEWINVIDDIVYKYFPLDKSITLSDTTLAWAIDKPLLIAASLLKNEVVLNATDAKFNRFYQACLVPSVPNLGGYVGAYCAGNDSTDVSPATFSRIPTSQPDLKAPPFLSQNSGQVLFNLGYKVNSDKFFGVDTLPHIQLKSPTNYNEVPVIIAAATSSAALGFLASEAFPQEGNGDTYDREAISYSWVNDTIQYLDPSTVNNMSFEDLYNNEVVSLADGGAVDNSGVAQLVSFLQQNNPATDTFHVVAFDNVTAAYPLEGTGTVVGTDIAYLFGEGLSPGNKFCAEKNEDCVTVPDLQIFASVPLTSTTAKWNYPGANGEELIYMEYIATTQDNPVFGITANTTVILHAFTCVYPTAKTAPMNESDSLGFAAYGDMLKFINTGLTENNGLIHLQQALGISQ